MLPLYLISVAVAAAAFLCIGVYRYTMLPSERPYYDDSGFLVGLLTAVAVLGGSWIWPVTMLVGASYFLAQRSKARLAAK